ncbi:MAG: hypothetical protein ACLFS3_02805, partial [Candidatus Aenigmatarchaeota archaeon]
MPFVGKIFILEGTECSGKSSLIDNMKGELDDAYFLKEVAKHFCENHPDLYRKKEEMEIAYITHSIRT